MNIEFLIEKLKNGDVTDAELRHLLGVRGDDLDALMKSAREIKERVYGSGIFVRGLIEVSSYCKNDCYYCGIRRSNRAAERYRLTPEQIVECAVHGHSLGFRTFVLQGGEDAYFTDDVVCRTVSEIKANCPDSAVTLSLGERSRESYARLREAGADRYLLRHESATPSHYAKLHPPELTLENRIRCLCDLKELGYQVGCGFMVGSPYQTVDDIVRDIRFIESFGPHMVGIGPYVTHKDTPFRDMPSGDVDVTLRSLAIVRHLLPEVLLPATTALGTVGADGRRRGIAAGANVVMPNLSPADVREKYKLYDNKLHTGAESAEEIKKLDSSLSEIGCHVHLGRGDHRSISTLTKEK